MRKQRAQIGGRGLRKIDRELRQQRLDQPRLVRAQLVALAPAEERARLSMLSMSSVVMLRDRGASHDHDTGMTIQQCRALLDMRRRDC